jgi:hypothetical protein
MIKVEVPHEPQRLADEAALAASTSLTPVILSKGFNHLFRVSGISI